MNTNRVEQVDTSHYIWRPSAALALPSLSSTRGLGNVSSSFSQAIRALLAWLFWHKNALYVALTCVRGG